MMSLWDALRMNMMISYQELVRTFPSNVIHGIIPHGTWRHVLFPSGPFQENCFRKTDTTSNITIMYV